MADDKKGEKKGGKDGGHGGGGAHHEMKHIDLPGLAISSGLAETFEAVIEDLDQFGMKAIGLNTIQTVLQTVGANNKYVIHGMDMLVRFALQSALPDQPVLRETMIGVSDAYFDKLKVLPAKDLDEAQWQRAKAEGIKSGLLKMKDLVAKKNAKPPIEKIVNDLPEDDRDYLMRLLDWAGEKDKQSHDEWYKYRDRIGSVTTLQYALKRAKAVTLPTPVPDGTPPLEALQFNAFIQYLETLYGQKRNIGDTVTALLRGEDNVHTKKVKDGLKKAEDKARTYADATKIKTDAARKKHEAMSLPFPVYAAIIMIGFGALVAHFANTWIPFVVLCIASVALVIAWYVAGMHKEPAPTAPPTPPVTPTPVPTPGPIPGAVATPPAAPGGGAAP